MELLEFVRKLVFCDYQWDFRQFDFGWLYIFGRHRQIWCCFFIRTELVLEILMHLVFLLNVVVDSETGLNVRLIDSKCRIVVFVSHLLLFYVSGLINRIHLIQILIIFFQTRRRFLTYNVLVHAIRSTCIHTIQSWTRLVILNSLTRILRNIHSLIFYFFFLKPI